MFPFAPQDSVGGGGSFVSQSERLMSHPLLCSPASMYERRHARGEQVGALRTDVFGGSPDMSAGILSLCIPSLADMLLF